MKDGILARATFVNKNQRLTLDKWHDVLGYINCAAMNHLEKPGLMRITDTTVVSEIRCTVYQERKSEVLSYGLHRETPRTLGEAVHSDLEGHCHADVTSMVHFQIFVDETSRDKDVVGIKRKKCSLMPLEPTSTKCST